MHEIDKASSSRLTCNDLDASRVTCIDHVLELGSVSTLGDERVGDGLVIGPPLGTLDMLLRRAHLGDGDGVNKLAIDAEGNLRWTNP